MTEKNNWTNGKMSHTEYTFKNRHSRHATKNKQPLMKILKKYTTHECVRVDDE